MTVKGALDGVRVIERVGRLAGSVCASLLADLGADVTSVIISGDPLPNEPISWRAHPFAQSGRSRIELDPSCALDADKWNELAAQADIVIVTSDVRSAGDNVHASLDQLTGNAVSTAKQILCVLTAYGFDLGEGPVPNPSEIEMQALSGLLATTGDTNGHPSLVGVPVLEIFTAINATTAIQAALRVKESGGGGQILDMAVFDTAFALAGTFLGNVLDGKTHGFRDGCAHPIIAPWNAYQTADGWVIVCTSNDQQWLNLLELIGRSDCATKPQFATPSSRVAHRDEVDAIITRWMIKNSTMDAAAVIERSGIPVGSVTPASDIGEGPKPVPCRRVTPAAASLPRAEVAQSNIGVAATHTGEQPPLSGIRIVEIGAYTAGPQAGRLLANMGAEVIKVEGIGGENSREWAPIIGGISSYFANYNAGKKFVELDLRSDAGRDEFLALTAKSDVVLHNLRAGAMERLGLGPDELFAVQPRLVYCAVSGDGQLGSKAPALDTVIQAKAGLVSLIESTSGPVKAGFSIADLGAAHMAAMEILAGLRHAKNSNQAQLLDISMFGVVGWMTGLSWPSGASVLGPATFLKSADDWVVAMVSPEELAGRGIGKNPSDLTAEQCIQDLEKVGIRAVKVYELDEVFDLDIIRRRSLLKLVGDGQAASATGDQLSIIAAPFRFTKTPTVHTGTVGKVGADNSV